MKVIRNSVIPFGKRYGAINLFGVLFAKRDMHLSGEVMNHELIHSAQIRELLFIPFYLIYIIEWLIRLVQSQGNYYEAYRRAYLSSGKHMSIAGIPDICPKRRCFAQWRK